MPRTTPPIHTDTSISFETLAGTTRMTIHTDFETGEKIVVDLVPGTALRMLSDLANATASSVGAAARALAIGPCEECNNTRVLTTIERGREQRITCTVCGPRRDATLRQGDFPAYPRAGGEFR